MTTLAWISSETPDVRGGGGQRRQFHQLKVLAEGGIDVRVAALAGLQQDVSVRQLVPVTRFRAQRLRGRAPTGALGRILDEFRPDGVVLAHIESVPLAARPVNRRGLPLLVDFHNVYSRYYELVGDKAAAACWRQRERDALAAAAVATACSRQEVEALRALGAAATVELAPNGVDPGEWPESALSADRPPVVAFFGSLAHRPNEEGLRWLVEHVWPRVTTAVPEARLLVLGPGRSPIRSRPGIELAGRVEDLPRALGGVRVAAVPILLGVGSRVKFGEALASGAAVVSTSVGCEGFDVTDGFVRADGPEAFAQACVGLLRDPARAYAMGHAGRALALERLTWQRSTAALLRFAEAL